MSYIKQFCEKYGFASEATTYLDQAFQQLKRCDESYCIFMRYVKLYEDNQLTLFKPALADIEDLQETTGVHKYTLSLLYLITLTKHLRELYELEHIPDEVFDWSVSDLKWKARECFNVYGVWGTYVAVWQTRFFKRTLFALGRLQFELRSFSYAVDVDTLHIEEGTPYINIHIPSCGPLDYTACHESYDRAAKFFRDRYGLKQLIFVCHSWLLSPELKTLLPENSRILSFAKDFTIIQLDIDPESKNLDKIFPVRTMPENPDELPANTSLQRTMKAWLKAGNSINNAIGVFLYE